MGPAAGQRFILFLWVEIPSLNPCANINSRDVRGF